MHLYLWPYKGIFSLELNSTLCSVILFRVFRNWETLQNLTISKKKHVNSAVRSRLYIYIYYL